MSADFFAEKPGNSDSGCCLCGGNVFIFSPTALLAYILGRLKM
jgi:hypothetical protein